MSDYEKVPPHSQESERGFLGCCLQGDPGPLIAARLAGLRPEMFFKEDHGAVFEHLCAIVDADVALDDIMLYERMKAKDAEVLERLGDLEWIFATQRTAQTTTPAKHYAKLIQEAWKKRQIIRAGREMIEQAYVPGDNFDDVRRSIQQPLTVLNGLSLSEMEVGAQEEIRQLRERKRREFAGDMEEVPAEFRVEIGMPGNAMALGHIDRRETDNYIVIGAPSSKGKSTLMRQIINWNLRQHPDWNIAVFLMEGGRQKFFHSLACNYAQLPNKRHSEWLNGEIAKGAEAAKKATAKVQAYFEHLDFLERAADQRLYVFERDRCIADIDTRCKELSARHGLDLIFVDYIQTVQSGKKGVNREQEVSHISNCLQAIQVSSGCPLITGSQLNAEGNARESGQIFNDSTRFWRIDRPKTDPNGVEQHEEGRKQYFQTLTQAKFRNGETGTVFYNFNTERGVFYDYSGIPEGKRGRPPKATAADAIDF